MNMLLVLRIALYIQLLLGLIRYIRPDILPARVWDIHPGLGIVIAILALIALRPVKRVPAPGLRAAARFMPLAPLALGLLFLVGIAGGAALVGIHMLLGIATIGLVEMAAGRERRSLPS